LKRYYIRYWRKIPDPFLGPKDVYYCYYSEVSQGRIPFVPCECPLIVIAGSPPFPECISSCNTSLYLKFLAPNLTVFSVATSLRETLSSKEIFAGREHLMNEIASIGIYAMLACSFCGVILTSFRWPAEESIGGCYIGEKNDLCSIRSPLSLLMMLHSSGFLWQLLWAS
jgi:hypothetical protein